MSPSSALRSISVRGLMRRIGLGFEGNSSFSFDECWLWVWYAELDSDVMCLVLVLVLRSGAPQHARGIKKARGKSTFERDNLAAPRYLQIAASFIH